MSDRSATLASMGFNADVGSETAHTEAMGTRKKSVGSRCSLTCRKRSPRKREDDLQPDMEHQGGSRDSYPLNATSLNPSLPYHEEEAATVIATMTAPLMKKLLLSADIDVYEQQEQSDCYCCADYGRRIRRIINCCCCSVFSRTIG